MIMPTNLDYPIIAIADLHGQLEQLKRLVARLEMLSEWDDCALVFLGDYVDRGEDVPGTIDMVLQLLRRRPGRSAVLGNHDLALVYSGTPRAHSEPARNESPPGVAQSKIARRLFLRRGSSFMRRPGCRTPRARLDLNLDAIVSPYHIARILPPQISLRNVRMCKDTLIS